MKTISRRTFLTRTASATAAALVSDRLSALPFDESLQAKLASDPLRPQYHLLPKANWMNDPNGPLFYDGRYHMFFQYNPNGAFWGSMHWAHAISPDLIHWTHEPVAMAPTPNGYDRDGVFSGSAVMDGRTPTMIYTGVLPPATSAEITLNDGNHKWREVQCLATSDDPMLRTWKKLPEPVIAYPPKGMQVTGFRDPTVWLEGDDWYLTLGSGFKGKGGAILLYRSKDLRHWEYVHPLVEGAGNGKASVNPVDNGEMWECPDFFPLGGKHVLLISTMGKVRWKTGTYREHRFTVEKEGVVDWGSYYAAKTQATRDGELILWGWIPETRPEEEYRAAGWAGLMSLPRTLSLGKDGTLEMTVAPAAELLRGEHVAVAPGIARAEKEKQIMDLRIRNLAAEMQVECSGEFQMELVSESGERFAEIVCGKSELRVNEVRGDLDGEGVSLRVFLDGSSLEVCANRRTAITARVYRIPRGDLRVKVRNVEGLRSMDVWAMRAISKDRLTT